MIIAAQLFADSLTKSGLYNCLLLIAKEQTAVQFIFLADEKPDTAIEWPANISFIKTDVPKKGMMLHYWYSVKLPALLKKQKATHFISETVAISLKLSIPQFLIVNNVSFLQKKPLLLQEYSRYIKKHFSKFAQKAASIFVTENFIADILKENYPDAVTKIKFVGHGISPAFKPVEWEEKDKFLEAFSNGTEYFIAECSIITRQNILSLVKAFSLFKKRQKSGMKLVLVLKGVSIEQCIKDFHLYKYREDVSIVPYSSEETYAEMLAAAYAAVYLPVQIIAEDTGLNALASGTALVTFKNNWAETTYKDAALYADLTEQSIADNMMLLYKDEALRKSVIETGLQIASAYNWAATSKELWQVIKS